VVGTVHERKAAMANLSEVMVVWPGGLGTAEEALVALRWTQVRVRVKPRSVSSRWPATSILRLVRLPAFSPRVIEKWIGCMVAVSDPKSAPVTGGRKPNRAAQDRLGRGARHETAPPASTREGAGDPGRRLDDGDIVWMTTRQGHLPGPGPGNPG
jgi:predicted RNase H-like nuclease